ncbi:hypothetical protein F5887DRAFT_881870 [Amanita rubescens]|nr:hypothetical protein F5887DRAFT_881870 [Amanita rubescens]
MLTLNYGSTCDVCLEQYGADHKAPYSIYCGHVFCLDCINRISPPECPLCRMAYTPGSCLKLHVDMSALCPTGRDREARRFQEAIVEVTNQGSSQTYLRQLITDCRNFLQGQPRSMYADLRVICRIVSYLCDVKSNLRERLQSLEDLSEQVSQLAADKSELQGKLESSESARDSDKQAAVDLELKLKEHVARAENAYQTLLEYVSFLPDAD